MELGARMENPPRESAGARTGAVPRKKLWTGRIMSGIAILFLTFDAVGKLLRLPPVVEGTARIGYPTTVVFGLGVVLLAGVALHAIPRTSVLGAIVLTGYLGGAVASNVRVGAPLLTNVLSPVYFGVLVWGGLVLRDPRVRALLPLRARG